MPNEVRHLDIFIRGINVRKRLSVLLLSCLIIFVFAAAAWAAPQVILDGTQLSFDVPPIIDQGRTLVPLRGIFEALGADLNWDQNTQTVTATKAGTEIRLVIGGQAYKNGQPIKLDVPAQITNGRTLIPLRFVSEALGASVDWNGTTQTVTIISQSPGTLANVIRVIDGDTIEVVLNNKTEKVRLIGVDTPETVHPTIGEEPYGKAASNFTKSQLEGKQITLEFDVQERDQYGRLLAYVWLNGQLFNEILIREGYAQVSTFPPNVKYVERFTSAQQKAREAGRGLWGAEEQTPQPIATSGKYIGSKESDKYHLPTCRWAEKITSENQIWFQTEEEAQSVGYEPCGVCKP